ncbi:hypothetical protein EST38_g9861 [Candolleomyces aberdarensis]|uniref:Isochorismatase-like domain-containing protein n=1 Tax=Candolleomyces aberdarensis TaxID=2316362 RepID=A0A4Q2DBR7_9AGAR|nr:hypothetical protein EST38_g9861 [Candolleomyces aberdarensis]
MPVPTLVPANTLFFLCDIQTKFQTAIHGYGHVVATANKLIKLAKARFSIPGPQRAALGPIDPAIDLPALGDQLILNNDKTLFSMLTADVKAVLDARPTVNSIVIFGIEASSHVCVLQTVLSLLESQKYTVHVVADGISSCNAFEVPIATQRMRQEGAIIGTSESIAFQLMKDAGLPQFKTFSKFIKEDKESTRRVGQALL